MREVGPDSRVAWQEAARKALQDMFSGQKDVLAAYDPGEAVTAGGDGSGGKGGAGGGFTWRPNWREWGDGFWRRTRVSCHSTAYAASVHCRFLKTCVWQMNYSMSMHYTESDIIAP